MKRQRRLLLPKDGHNHIILKCVVGLGLRVWGPTPQRVLVQKGGERGSGAQNQI